MENKFGEFYESVEDEAALRDANIKLKIENDRTGNQVHNLTAEIISLKEERQKMTEELTEQKHETAALNAELKKSRSMFQALQEKFDKVMRFIESLNLKKRLEEFLKPAERKR